MKKKIVARGRSILGSDSSDFIRSLETKEGEKVFTLKSGNQAKFTLSTILNGDIEEKTFVDPTVNGRDQRYVTPESVSDITRTINLQQFFPAIGRIVGDRIEVLDGSRRRAACIFSGVKFEILVTEDEISLEDARQLAKDIQTAREHTLREIGQRYQLMYANGLSKDEIARAEGVSPASVTRAFQAASVPTEMVALFPVIHELSLADYQLLLKISDDLDSKGMSLEILIGKVQTDINAAPTESVSKLLILDSFKRNAKQMKPAPLKTVQTEKLHEFEDKKQFARKKTDPSKRLVTYEFARLPASVQAELDKAIKQVMDSMQASEK
ncbi:ParB/RepB/Spo0J family partition protein [Enterobacter cloacae]|uniref:ParB family protein n=1 Tax=Enterobacter cloacae TaxID=550 RepID=UPI0034A2BA7D